MPFVTTATGTAALDNSLVTNFSNIAYFAALAEEAADQFAQESGVDGKTITWSKYGDLSVDTSELTELDDVASTAMTDTDFSLTPAEIGMVITKTRLASFQTGGKIDVAAAKAIGRAAGQKKDKLAMGVLEAASPLTTVYAGSATAASNLSVGDTAGKTFVNKLYNKLRRRNTPVNTVTGTYVAIAHDDVIADIRDEVGDGAFVDVMKYKSPDQILNQEVGRFGGFTWISSGNATITADANGTIDAYKVLAFGDEVLYRAVSEAVGIRLTGPFDKLGRFLNVGFYGILKYGVFDANNLVHGVCASSFGSN